MIQDIAFKNYSKKDDIHGSVLYPAVMVAPIQKAILKDILDRAEIKSIFDPFHGSGTSLYEVLEINEEVKLIGCDINPLANLITTVKLQGVDKEVFSDIEKISIAICDIDDGEKHSFNNIKKWFRDDIIRDLTKIRISIKAVKSKRNRLFFWCMMCDIVRKYSNTRSSTYKLHIKKEHIIKQMENNVIRDFLCKCTFNAPKYVKKSSNYTLFKCDVLEKLQEFDDNEVDITITSPPYGDNATTVTYGQFSILSLLWIDSKDLELEGWELENFSIIDSKSMGGHAIILSMSDSEIELINPYLSRIKEDKTKKVIRFFNDYFSFLSHICRVTGKYIVMTLGNRTVDGVNINLTQITQKFLESNGYVKQNFLKRKIRNKRIPVTTSSVNNRPVSSMNHEYLIIYEKS